MEISLNVLFKLFFIAICIDFLTGVIASAKEGKLKSRTCSNGIFRSIGECIVLIIFLIVDYLIPELDFILNTFVVGFIFKEGISIVENLIKLGVWVPESLQKALEVGVSNIENKEVN